MSVEQVLPFAFPFFFIGIWLAVTTVLSIVSGWKRLAESYPDRDDETVARFPMASGTMGGVRMNGILTLTVCRSGLRLAMWKVFGPFDRPFFVPWDQVSVQHSGGGFLKRGSVVFGAPPVGRMDVNDSLAAKLAARAPNCRAERTGRQNARIVS